MLTFLNRTRASRRSARRRWIWRLRERCLPWKHRTARLLVYGLDQHGNRTLFDYDNPDARAANELGALAREQAVLGTEDLAG